MAQDHVLISCVKDEGPFLVEWVAHHLVVGFDRICIASNDCSDGSDRLLDAMDRAGLIRHVPNPVPPGEIPQHAGYARIRATEPLDRAEWLMMLDADEFLNIHAGSHRVQDLTALAAGDADIIALSARTFSDAPEVNWRPGPVTALFPMALPARHKANKAVKTLTRLPRRFRGIHNHHMIGWKRKPEPIRLLRAGDGARIELDPEIPLFKVLRNFATDQIGHRLAQYNHYAIRTWDSFALRRLRGRGAVATTTDENQRHTEAYFNERRGGEEEERSIARHAAALRAQMADMLGDPAIRAAHAACEAAYAEACRPFRRSEDALREIAPPTAGRAARPEGA